MIHSIYSQLYICISKSKFRTYFLYSWKFRIPISQILGPPLLPSRHNEELHSTTCVYCMYIYRQHKDACRKETSWQPNKSQQLPPSLRGTTEMASVGGTRAKCSSSVTLGVAHLVNKDSAKAALWSVKRRRMQVFP